MKNPAPLKTPWPEGEVPPAWAAWFQQVFSGFGGWQQSMQSTTVLDFPSIAANSEASLTVTIKGARAGANVPLTPSTNVSGLIFSGVVTANDTVTVYAKNFTTGAINPASLTFNIIVLQN